MNLSEDKTYCFYFTRDNTVSTGEPEGPIDVEILEDLNEYGKIWAIGNQRLVDESKVVDGKEELFDQLQLPRNVIDEDCGPYGIIQMAFKLMDANTFIVVSDNDYSDIEYVMDYDPNEFIQDVVE